jgi:rare lipoprotein A (peptidoglycan hydrolase)
MQIILRRICFFSVIAIVAWGVPGIAGRADAQIGRIQPKQYVQVGVASWYGPWHQGRRTANGERFDMHKLTAAHKTLPLDSKVRVTNLANGKSVEVKINDRGPYVGDRVIDLSERAAQRLGMKQQGVATVRVEVVDSSTDGYAYD